MNLILATTNRGKIAEFQALLPPTFQVISLAEAGLEAPDETGSTFEQNARLKALSAALTAGIPALADDSGLEVDGLGGAPGVQSARYSGANATDQSNIRKLLADLERRGITDRTARFRCVVALALPTGEVTTAQGSCEGSITLEPRGEWGFGYDPIFELPDGQTMAELDPGVKNQVSHRAVAFRSILPAVLALEGVQTPVPYRGSW